MKKERRQWSAEEKTRLLRRHLIEKVPISKICEEERLAPSLYHRWQEQLFQNAAPGLAGARAPERVQAQQRIEKLESKIRQKDEVLADPKRTQTHPHARTSRPQKVRRIPRSPAQTRAQPSGSRPRTRSPERKLTIRLPNCTVTFSSPRPHTLTDGRCPL